MRGEMNQGRHAGAGRDPFLQWAPAFSGVKRDRRAAFRWRGSSARVECEAAVGAAPDVAQLAQVWPRSFSAAGALRPLDDLIAKTNIGVAGWDEYVARDMQ